MVNFNEVKENSKQYITDRHKYVNSIISNLYLPEEYKSLCEVGAGNMELATLLSDDYDKVDAFEPYYNGVSYVQNLNIYPHFSNLVNVEEYDLVISVCPYIYSEDIYDYADSEKETKELLYNIVDKCIENDIDLFLVLSNTSSGREFIDELKNNPKYKNILNETIDLYFERLGETKISTNNVLLIKR